LVAGAGGSFQFPAVPPGVYRVTTVMDGFDTRTLENIKVTLDQTTESSAEQPRGATCSGVRITF
jgi:hypothetical protein